MSYQLTEGAIMRAYANDTKGNPVLQIIDVKKIGASTPDRYRVIISDGQFYAQGMLATQLNSMYTSGALKTHCIIQLNEFLSNMVANRRVLILLQLKVVDQGPGRQIGNPQSWEKGASGAAPSGSGTSGGGTSGGGTSGGGTSYGGSRQQDKKRPLAGGSHIPPGKRTRYVPISALTPYSNKWTIKARVTTKGDIREYISGKGGKGGRLFSVDLLDSNGGQIRATMFNQSCDKFFHVFQKNQVYVISNGQVRNTNPKFNTLGVPYELHLNEDAQVTQDEDDQTIETQKYTFTSIDELETRQAGDFVDVIGIVLYVSEAQIFTAQKTGKELKKRTVSLTDQSTKSIELTVWNDKIDSIGPEAKDHVLAVKRVRVSDFQGGKSINSSFGSIFVVDPPMPECTTLQSWYESKGRGAHTTNLSEKKGGGSGGGGTWPRTHLLGYQELGLGKQEKPEYFVTRATVTFIRHDFKVSHDGKSRRPWYSACSNILEATKRVCNKKVGEDLQCFRCGQTTPVLRYMLSVIACDRSGSEWLTAFNEQAEELLQKNTAEQLSALLDQGGEDEVKRIFQGAQFKTYKFTISVSTKAGNNSMDGPKPRCTIANLSPINYKDESLFLLQEISKFG